MRKGRISETMIQAATPLTGACSDQPRIRPLNAPSAVPTVPSTPNRARTAATMAIPAATRSRLDSMPTSPGAPRRTLTEPLIVSTPSWYPARMAQTIVRVLLMLTPLDIVYRSYPCASSTPKRRQAQPK